MQPIGFVRIGPAPGPVQGLRIKIERMGKIEKPALESDFDQYPEKPGDFLNIVTQYDVNHDIKLLLQSNSDYWNSVKPRVFFVRKP